MTSTVPCKSSPCAQQRPRLALRLGQLKRAAPAATQHAGLPREAARESESEGRVPGGGTAGDASRPFADTSSMPDIQLLLEDVLRSGLHESKVGWLAGWMIMAWLIL